MSGKPRHGMARTRTWSAWKNMKARCLNPNHPRFADWGGRGIRVCERWLSFDNFFADMGECPAGMTLDRHPDNDGNYEPGNARWATRSQQQRNMRTTVLTEDLVHEIHGRLDHGEPMWSLAQRMGVAKGTLTAVRIGSSWKDLWSSPPPGSAPHQHFLSEDDALEILGRFEHGDRVDSIAERMHIGRSHVRRIVNGESWPQLGGART